jgi:hypothetical protein
LANRPSAGLATQTLGGVYSGVSVIRETPDVIGTRADAARSASSYTTGRPSRTRCAPNLALPHAREQPLVKLNLSRVGADPIAVIAHFSAAGVRARQPRFHH